MNTIPAPPINVESPHRIDGVPTVEGGVDSLTNAPSTPSRADWSAAINSGNEAQVQQWLTADPPSAQRCSEWIGWAVTWGRTGIVRRLLPHVTRAALNAASPNALMLAARYAKVDLVILLLPWFDDPLQQNTDGQTALHLAAIARHAGTVKALLPVIPATTLNSNGALALHKAAAVGATEVIDLLLPYGGVNHQDHDGCTPLLKAIGSLQADAVERLAPLTDLSLRYGGRTALEWAHEVSAMSSNILIALKQATHAWETDQLRRASDTLRSTTSPARPTRHRL